MNEQGDSNLNLVKSPHILVCSLTGVALTGLLQASAVFPVAAQVAPDNTLGSTSSVVKAQAGQNLLIEGGARNHSNLFHSFQEFNVNKGQQVFFANPEGVNNIIARVTGNKSSNINGVLGVKGLANLFLINPQGIIFDADSRLNIKGSFIASTAESLNFSDGSFFSAVQPNSPPLLTVNVPIGLQYGVNPAPIQLQQANLKVEPGKILGLIGGNVSLNKATLTAPGGRIYLGGLLASGNVRLDDLHSFNFPEGVKRGDVSLINQSRVDVIAGGGGDIIIDANNVSLSNSSFRAGIAANFGKKDTIAGNIDINATGNTTLENQSNISNVLEANSLGNGGIIAIKTANLFLKDAVVSADIFSSGNAGNLIIQAANKVEIISSPINLMVAGERKGLFSRVALGATGTGGNITVNAQEVNLSGIGGIDSSTVGLGNGGKVVIESNRLNIIEGAAVLSNTNSSGNAGEILIKAPDFIEISNKLSDPQFANLNHPPGGIVADVRTGASGHGGKITVEVGRLTVREGGIVTTDTKGSGDGGDINIRARELVEVVGVDKDAPTQLVAAVRPNATGEGGNLIIQTKNLIVRDGGEINVGSQGSGNAGNLKIQGEQIFLNNATISAETATGNQGNIYLNGTDIRLRQGSRITTNATQTATGGNIQMNTNTLIAFENSDITANAKASFGGRVIINAQGIFGTQFREFLTPKSDITATSTLGAEFNGIVKINTPDVDPTSGIAELPSAFTDSSNQIAAACPANTDNAFIVTGRGGLPTDPKEVLRAPVLIEDWRVSPHITPQARQQQITQKNKKINTPMPIVEAQAWKINGQDNIELVASLPHDSFDLRNNQANCLSAF